MLRRIQKGGKLGVIAPGFQPNPDKLQKGIDYLTKLGYAVKRGKSLTAKHGYLAGDDNLRIDDLHSMFSDPEIDGIICARGGWGCLRLLDKLDYDMINQNPKLLVGYSDITTLQLALWQKAGIPSLSGPMAAVEMGGEILEFTEKHFWGQINNRHPEYTINFKDTETIIWQSGQAEGRLLGGCLSIVASQLGTGFSPNYRDSILFLEEVGEKPYRVDRSLAQLKQAGIFNQINGLILGNFIDCVDENDDQESFSIEEVLQDYFGNSHYPVLFNFPYGHGMKKVSMPVGVLSKLDTAQTNIKFVSLFIK
jgi:muramoyltetrapeptide carboxypeptidase